MRRRLIFCSISLFAIGAVIIGCGDDSDCVTCSADGPDYAVPLRRTAWHFASPPVSLPPSAERARLLWHTPFYLRRYDDIWDADPQAGQSAVVTLRFIFRPSQLVTVDPGTENLSRVAQEPTWAGATALYSGEPIDTSLTDFDIRMLQPQHGKMHIDMGRVSEDLNGDGIAYTEDTNFNGVVDWGEDVGLDNLPDTLEPGYDQISNPDPSQDNWYFRGVGQCPVYYCDQAYADSFNNPEWEHFYDWLNGTEGNVYDPAGYALPDRENLDPGGFEQRNDYYSFLLDFDNHPDSFRVDDSQYNGWVTYRIPIHDPAARQAVVGEPTWSDFTHIRVWFESLDTDTVPDTIEIAGWRFLQAKN